MPTIELKHLCVTYLGKKNEQYPALKDISCVFENKKVSCIMGESGGGKTTLLRALSSQLSYDGLILSDGKDIEKMSMKERKIGYVQQEFALYPHMTIFDNLAFPLKLERDDFKTITDKVNEMAKTLNISYLLTRKPRQLSTGQIQKVCLGRALIKKPELILLDEPLSNVDGPQKEDVLRTIKNALEAYGVTAIYITHNLKEAIYISSKIYLIENGALEWVKPSSELGEVDIAYIFDKETSE